MHEEAELIKKQCCTLIFERFIELDQIGIDGQKLIHIVEIYFESLMEYIEIETAELDDFVQRITKALPNQTEFIYKFRKCVYGMNDYTKNLQTIHS